MALTNPTLTYQSGATCSVSAGATLTTTGDISSSQYSQYAFTAAAIDAIGYKTNTLAAGAYDDIDLTSMLGLDGATAVALVDLQYFDVQLTSTSGGGTARVGGPVDGGSTAQKDRITLNAAATGGSLVLKVQKPDGTLVNTGAIGWLADDTNYKAAINAALDTATGVAGGIVASGATPDTVLDLSYSGGPYLGAAWVPAVVTTFPTSTATATYANVTPPVQTWTTNALWFGSQSSTWDVKPGGPALMGGTTGTPVTVDSTHKKVRITNSHASLALTYVARFAGGT